MPRGITLTRQAQTIYNAANLTGYRFTVTASNGLNMADEIFRYTKGVYDYVTNLTDDLFDGVCTSEQLASLPTGAPDPEDPDQLFRKTTIDLIFKSQADADEAWTAIKSDVDSLIKAMNFNDVLGSPETTRIGDS